MNIDKDVAMFKTWSDAQQRLWENISKALPAFKPPEEFNLPKETYMRHLSAWESAVEQALAMQKAWLEEWSASVLSEHDAPAGLTQWSHQVEEVMQAWLEAQTQLWHNWFQLLRDEDADEQALSEAAKKVSAAKTGAVPSTAAPELAMPKAAKPKPAKTAKPKPAKPAETQPEARDDLKLIKGIGPKVEEKLNADGIVNYRQVAALDEAKIQDLETRIIKFSGRIGRDDWIGQAKKLHAEKYKETL